MPVSSQRNALTSVYRKAVRKARRAGDAEGMEKALAGANAHGLQVTGIGRVEERRAGDVAAGNSALWRTGQNVQRTRSADEETSKSMNSTGPRTFAATGNQLTARQGLFKRIMAAGAAKSGDFREEAAGLGVTDSGYDNALKRAFGKKPPGGK